MDRLKRFAAVLILALWALPAFGQENPYFIDWVNMRLVVSGTGDGSSVSSENAMERQYAATLTAEQDLTRNFIGSMTRLRINGYDTAAGVLKMKIEKNAPLLMYLRKSRSRVVSYDEDKITITQSFPFFGTEGFMHILCDPGEDTGHFFRYGGYDYSVSFSGLVIDARGLDRVPAAMPRIFDDDHNLVFSADIMEKDAFHARGAVQYVTDPYYRGFEDRVGGNALHIVAVKNDKLLQSDLSISDADARILLADDATRENLLKGRVIIIIDSL